ncbi:alpha-galactosidase [Rathayibacter sp. PhB127]|uniref:alpha-galactosidase n=1 Tax=Rathayibacter sp. PhB127 TaxID=2485176 RepID=UPI000F4B3E47|nr:alpha-galactosidase [Rathayibacter sp. PhB127]ROS21561.1 alpha-galactosidase [Rathayibacter sp. PhB127]
MSVAAPAPDAFVHLRASGVSVVLDLTSGRLPAVLHWGADLGTATLEDVIALAEADVEPVVPNVVDEPIRLSLLPEQHTGWVGRPGLSGHREGTDWSPLFRTTALSVDGSELGSGGALELVSTGPATVLVHAVDETAELALELRIELLGSGLLRARAALTNLGTGTYTLDALTLALPIPARGREILDFAGRWGKERVPQRRELVVGLHEREGRRGRTGADAATVLSVGVPGFGFAAGEVWGIHVGFSGNHRHYAERLSNGFQVLGGGELLLPGEVRLAQGAAYEGPWVYGAYGTGLDDQAHRFHRFLRSRPSHPRSPRPVTLNVWEAVYFDHDLDRLRDLADRAGRLGVERYVLDDGWFRGRRDDTAGLGDWSVDQDVWPDGLGPLVDHVRGLGMEFGLWFEPEMINLESDLAAAHPEWIMATGGRLPVPSRHQHVLNLGVPEAYEHVLARISAILTEYDIAYVKWDHNRDLVDAGTSPSGVAGVHVQTLSTYRLLDELRRRFPGLEIESCSSGGARVDLGILERTDRVWVSDCIDPLERQQMNRWTMQLLPPELLGSHIASGVSHTTGRSHRLSFRAGTALFGHLGIEWDLATATEAESEELQGWIALYREHRRLLHSGDVIRVDEADDTLLVYGAVAEDRSEALFFLASIGRSAVSPRGRFVLPALDADSRYRVRPVFVGGLPESVQAPVWFGEDLGGDGAGFPGTVLSGRALAAAGLQTPAILPDETVVLSVVREG